MNPVQLVTLSTSKNPQPPMFHHEAMRRPTTSLPRPHHEQARHEVHMQDQDILAAHIKDSYGNFTLPKLFIDVRGLTFVVVTRNRLFSVSICLKAGLFIKQLETSGC